MLSIVTGGLSAASLGVADFIASQSSERLGAPRALAGMLFVSSIILTMTMLVGSGFNGLFSGHNMPSVMLAILHGATMAIALLLFFYAMSVGKISIVAPIIAAHPIFIVLYHWAGGSELTALQIIAIVGVLTGVALVGGAGSDHAGKSADVKAYAPLRRVVLVSVIASLIYGVAIILLQGAAGGIEDLQILWFGRVAGFVTVIVVLMFMKTQHTIPSAMWWGVFVIHGLLDSGGFLFILWGTNGSNNDALTAVVASTFPIVTMGIAWLVLNERLNRFQFAGATMVFISIAILIAYSKS